MEFIKQIYFYWIYYYNNSKQFKYSTFTPIKWSQFGQSRTTTGTMSPTGSEECALRLWDKTTMEDLE